MSQYEIDPVRGPLKEPARKREYVIISSADPSFSLKVAEAELIKARTYAQMTDLYNSTIGSEFIGGPGNGGLWWTRLAKELVDRLYTCHDLEEETTWQIMFISKLELKAYAGTVPIVLSEKEKYRVAVAMECINDLKQHVLPNQKRTVQNAINRIQESLRWELFGHF